MRKTKRLPIFVATVVAGAVLLAGTFTWNAANPGDQKPNSTQSAQLNKQTGYTEVNGVNMYYETYGQKNNKPPLLLLHGSLTNIDVAFSEIIPELAKDRYVIGVDMQAHGHTADVDSRPLALQLLADDVAIFLQQKKIAKADIFGWSMGGMVATELVLRHPELVHKTAAIGASYKSFKDLFEPAAYEGFIASFQPGFAPKPFKEPYDKVSPNPEKWDQLVVKIREQQINNTWPTDEQIKSIKTPFLIMLGDREPIPLTHAVEWYKLLPQGQLDILPNADHFATQLQPKVVLDSLQPFLDGPESVSNDKVNNPDTLEKR